MARLQEAPAEKLESVKLVAYSALSVAKVKVTQGNRCCTLCDTGVFIAGMDQAIIAGTTGFKGRGIDPPTTKANSVFLYSISLVIPLGLLLIARLRGYNRITVENSPGIVFLAVTLPFLVWAVCFFRINPRTS